MTIDFFFSVIVTKIFSGSSRATRMQCDIKWCYRQLRYSQLKKG